MLSKKTLNGFMFHLLILNTKITVLNLNPVIDLHGAQNRAKTPHFKNGKMGRSNTLKNEQTLLINISHKLETIKLQIKKEKISFFFFNLLLFLKIWPETEIKSMKSSYFSATRTEKGEAIFKMATRAAW